jgi:aspartyl-tRNA(Asn)/glutamyl-tRNA(Gln) amidotransferase subunit B
MKKEFEVVIGLEVHTELSTKSKIFCGCATSFGGEANSRVCPVCAGFPGSLPRLNKRVVEYAVMAGLALNCQISKNCKFDRKNYFYPDLPKAYQVSQLYVPICLNGHLDIEADGAKKAIGIREIHMEEDAGKLTHDPRGGSTFMDFNRCGVPLLEIVSNPDFRSANEVLAYLEKLREILLYLGVSDCKMQEGSLRVDVNLSVRRFGEELGVRTETKNLNSFKAVARAIECERERQIEILEEGGKIKQETLRWDDDKGVSHAMRSKENAQDYRYFPEPDLLPISIDDDWFGEIKSNLPELSHQKRERYVRDFKLSEYEAGVITAHKNVSELFEEVGSLSSNPLESAHLITGEIMRLMNQTDTLPENLTLDAKKLATLIKLVLEGKISRAAYKKTLEAVFLRDVDVDSFINENGLMMKSDSAAVDAAVREVLNAYAKDAEDYRQGNLKAFGFLMGQVMKKLGAGGNPSLVKEAIERELS